MRRLTIAGLMAALTLGSFVVVASAQVTPPPTPQPRPDFWPKIDVNKQPVAEWYSDVPWTQKLGTYRGNEIDEALVLPYDALGENEKLFCKSPTDLRKQSACMIETGVNSILGTYRTDTFYDETADKIKAATYCKSASHPSSQSCIEVKLALAMFWTRSNDAGSVLKLEQRPFGNDLRSDPNYGGYVITDGTTYAPQMPWYMSHYCDSQFTSGAGDALDPVCYADYFTSFNDGFNILPMKQATAWPDSFPWSVSPALNNDLTRNHCQSVLTTCTLVMGAFDLSPVTNILSGLQYYSYKPPQQAEPDGGPNNRLFTWFNNALTKFPNNFTSPDFYRHFPWSATTQVTWGTTPLSGGVDLYPQARSNPFLGQYTFTITPEGIASCTISLTQADPAGCTTKAARADHYLYPRQCTLADLATTDMDVARLRACGLNYELHHNGWLDQWPTTFRSDLRAAGMLANQYGRTSFLFAGVPGMQLPVSFYNVPGSVSGLNEYEQVYNASIFSVYLPIANEADFKNALTGRNYPVPQFYHTLLMTNHMEADPDEFAQGIRGKVLWHDEYRTEKMYNAFANKISTKFPTRTFAAAFDPQTAPVPFHNNTCDGCHVRNGSGIPINSDGKLDVALQGFMTSEVYNPSKPGVDYTFTGKIRPMKLVFFDLKRVTSSIDDSVYSKPQVTQVPTALRSNNDPYYNNKIMNFYGDSFHVAKPGNNNYPVYDVAWTYVAADSNRIVVKQPDGKTPTPRKNAETGITYQPLQVSLGLFKTDPGCQLVAKPRTSKPWPTSCNDINSTAIHEAIDRGFPTPSVGFMLLNGKRLGNLSAIEAIPNAAILGFYQNQTAALGPTMAGEILWNTGSRDGVGGDVKKACTTKSLNDCWIGRFGWLGDRVSLEDQVANAAFVEMNMTSSEGYKKLYGNGNVMFPIRYNVPDCGPADKKCVQSKGNEDLSELDINRMAAYARWLGNPTRSEFTASLPDVVAGETIFGQIKCDTCHVISKIAITDPNDTMLTEYFRNRLAKRVDNTNKVYPFLSYLGTDLLMHDMGYLSQVGNSSQSIRDADGTVRSPFQNFVQKIRTPALKGLRFNRFVTDSQLNTKNPCSLKPTDTCDPACDFLLHDGRACDAIEAAFLHDGPAIQKLGVIPALNALNATQVRQLRAFLYSL